MSFSRPRELEMISRYTLLWFVLAVVAVANGVFREATYGNRINELAAHQLSTLMGIFCIGVVVWLFSRVWPIQSARQAWFIGLIWLAQTIAFEFVFGRLVAGHSWQRLLADYDLSEGRVWLLFLLWILVVPYACYRLHGRRA